MNTDVMPVKEALNGRAEELCRMLLPGGKRVGGEWHAGDISGGPGDSLKVQLCGEKVGLWKDWAGSPEDEGDLFTLWQRSRNVDFKTALHDAALWAGVSINGNRSDGKVIARDMVVEWKWCVEAVGDSDLERLAAWRGYSLSFCQWLKSQKLVGLYNGNIALPIHNEVAIPIGIHHRLEDGSWRVVGGSISPLIIGDMGGGFVSVFESQWDAFAMMDKLGWHEKPQPGAIFITRGASNGKKIHHRLEKGTKILAFPQNDEEKNGRNAAEQWLKDVMHPECIVKRVDTPSSFKDLNDWTRAGATEQDVRAAIAAATIVHEPQQESLGKCIVSGAELAAMEVEPRECILRPFFKVGDFGIVFAKRGECKTWLSMLMAEAIAFGGCAGDWKAERPQSVLYVDGEMPLEETKRRSKLLAGATQSGQGSLLHFLHHEVFFERVGKSLNLTDKATQEAILNIVVARSFKVVMLDNLTCLFSGMKENDADAWELVLPWLLHLRRLKVAVVLIAHAGRNGEIRGTSRREDQAFWVLKLEKSQNDEASGAKFTTLFTKNRNALEEECPPLEWNIREENGMASISVKQSSGVALLVAWVTSGLDSATDIAAEMGLSKGQVSKLAKKAESQGLIVIKRRRYELPAT